MSAAQVVLVVMWIGVTAYALLGGADFGGGFWDLVAGDSRSARSQRRLIERSIGPIWEANHVWLIFVLVILWTAFPPVFAAVASTLYIPLTAAAIGIILRGSGFAFRKSIEDGRLSIVFGRIFGLSSVLTPFFLGAAVGGVASGRVPPGNVQGDVLRSWLSPTSILGGALSVTVCAYLAAVYLTADAVRNDDAEVADAFRTRGLRTAVVTGAIALGGIWILRYDAGYLFDGLVGRGVPLVMGSVVGGLLSLYFLATRRYVAARLGAGLAVASVIWGWGVAQYPQILVGYLSVREAAASAATTTAVLITLGVGAVFVVPGLVWMFWLFQTRDQSSP